MQMHGKRFPIGVREIIPFFGVDCCLLGVYLKRGGYTIRSCIYSEILKVLKPIQKEANY